MNAMPLRMLLFVTLCLTAAPPETARVDAKASGLDQSRLASIPERMKAFIDNGQAAGIVTLVQRRGALGHLEAVGMQDREKKLPMKTDTIFEVMSMTKPVTSVAIMMLMEEGLLALTDPVEKHLPEFRGQLMAMSRNGDQVTLGKPSRKITIRDLMTHTSGLQEMPPEGLGGAGLYYTMDRTLADAVSLYSQLPLQFEPGTKWSYSNTGMATLGRIVEVVGGKPYEKFLADRIFEPLGMKDSFFFPQPETYARIAAVYQPDKSGKLQNLGDGIYRKGAKYSMPEGGLYSTAQDMAAFYQMMLNGGMANGKRLLSKASVESMTMMHTAGTGNTWGLGWAVASGARSTLTLSSEGTYGHGGAFGTYGWVDPKKQLVGVFMIQVFGAPVDGIRNTFVDIANSAVVE